MKKQFIVQYYERIKQNKAFPLYYTNRKYVLFPKDNAVTDSLIRGWDYEPYIWRFLNRNCISLEGSEVIDVGANNGQFTIEFANLVGDSGKVYSFEPQRIIFQQLCGNVFMNGFDNVYAHHLAIGDKNEDVCIEVPDYFSNEKVNFGEPSIQESGEKVKCVCLDDFKFNKVSLLKCDVQGYEHKVILGAKNTIAKHRPYIIFEVEGHLLEKYDTSEEKLIKEIEGLGYIVKEFEPNIPYQTYSGKCLDRVGIPIELYEQQEYLI